MQRSFKVASINGIGILVNWTWLLAIAFMTWSLGDYYHSQFARWSLGTDYVLGAVSGILLFVTVLIHELAHSFTARANGLHVDNITLFIFGGVSSLDEEPRTARIELLVALAGPLASLALAALFFLLHAVTSSTSQQVTAVLGYLASINLLLALFNLIPGFPLDGGRVLRAIIWAVTGNLRRATHAASNVGQGIGILFILGGLIEAFVAGQFASGIWLVFIGWFLQSSAGASYQQTVMDQVLSGVEVRDVMDKSPLSVSPTLSIEGLVYGHMLDHNQAAVAVAGPENLLRGVVSLGDLRKIPRDQWNSTPVTEIMTRLDDLQTVSPDSDLRSALPALSRNEYHLVPVTENRRLVGMLDRGRVMRYLSMRQQFGPGPHTGPREPYGYHEEHTPPST